LPDRGEDLLTGGADLPELLLHGLLEGDLAGTQAGLERRPDAPGPEGLDDHVERVATRDRPVEVAGDQQCSHGRRSLPARQFRPAGEIAGAGSTRGSAVSRRAGPPRPDAT